MAIRRRGRDAFDRQVGTEPVGIYSDNDVRSFDPIDAGNARVQGLYFGELDGLPNRLVDGGTIRLGFSIQGQAERSLDTCGPSQLITFYIG